MKSSTILWLHPMLLRAPSLSFSFSAWRHVPTRRSYHRTSRQSYGYPRKTPALYLNRILFDSSEIDDVTASFDEDDGNNTSSDWMVSVTLPKSDYRTIHVAKILRLQNGDLVRAGSVIHCQDEDSFLSNNIDRYENTTTSKHHLQGLLTDHATIQWLPEGKIKKAHPTKNGDPPGSLRLHIPPPPQTTLQTTSQNTLPISLLLALPRPLQLQRILPMISQLGVNTLILTHASKVPKDYFGSHLFRKPKSMQDLLIEGLTLSGMDLKLPRVLVSKRPIGEMFGEDLERWFPEEEWMRVVAHPERSGDDVGEVVRMTDLDLRMEKDSNGKKRCRKILVAVGPEGGWEEPNELELFAKHGFQKVTLGSRVLRSDVAVVSLLALAHEVYSKANEENE